VNKSFIKDPREDDPPGKGTFWRIHPDHTETFTKIPQDKIPKIDLSFTVKTSASTGSHAQRKRKSTSKGNVSQSGSAANRSRRRTVAYASSTSKRYYESDSDLEFDDESFDNDVLEVDKPNDRNIKNVQDLMEEDKENIPPRSNQDTRNSRRATISFPLSQQKAVGSKQDTEPLKVITHFGAKPKLQQILSVKPTQKSNPVQVSSNPTAPPIPSATTTTTTATREVSLDHSHVQKNHNNCTISEPKNNPYFFTMFKDLYYTPAIKPVPASNNSSVGSNHKKEPPKPTTSTSTSNSNLKQQNNIIPEQDIITNRRPLDNNNNSLFLLLSEQKEHHHHHNYNYCYHYNEAEEEDEDNQSEYGDCSIKLNTNTGTITPIEYLMMNDCNESDDLFLMNTITSVNKNYIEEDESNSNNNTNNNLFNCILLS
jgi:hypothetical protein